MGLFSNFYKLKLRVIDYQTDCKEILYTDYNYSGDANLDYDISYLIDNMLQGNPIEFAIDSIPEGNPDEIYPLIVKMSHIKLESRPSGVNPTLYGRIIMADGIAIEPYDQQGDVYDNILGLGFEVYDAYSVPVKAGSDDMMDAED